MILNKAETIRRLSLGGYLGLVWFAALLIPESTRLALIGEDRAWWRMLAGVAEGAQTAIAGEERCGS